MTAIAAVSYRGNVWMAADSAVSWGDRKQSMASPKVWRCGEYVMGAAGAAAFDRLLTAVRWDRPIDEMIDQLVAAIARLGMDADEGEALIGYRGGVYYYADRSLFRSGDSFGAVGAGAPHLLGYLDASRGMPPGPRVHAAVRSACRYVDGCGLPVVTVATVD